MTTGSNILQVRIRDPDVKRTGCTPEDGVNSKLVGRAL